MANDSEVNKDKDKGKDKDNDKAKDKDADKAKAKPAEGAEVSAKGEMSTKKLVVLMSSAFLVILAVTVALLIILLKPSKPVASQVAAVTSTAIPGAAPATDPLKPVVPIYQAQFIKIEPSFVVNFTNNQNIKFLEVAVTLVAKTDREATSIKSNLPFIKDQLVTLFSSQKYEDIHTQQGKDLLRNQALALVQQVLEKEAGEKCVSDILFTSFVMQ